MNPAGIAAALNYYEDGITPYMLFFKDGVVSEKFVSTFMPCLFINLTQILFQTVMILSVNMHSSYYSNYISNGPTTRQRAPKSPHLQSWLWSWNVGHHWIDFNSFAFVTWKLKTEDTEVNPGDIV